MPEPINLLEGIGNGENGALSRSTRYYEQMVNISYFYNPLESIGNHRRLITCGFIYRAHAGVHHFTAQY